MDKDENDFKYPRIKTRGLNRAFVRELIKLMKKQRDWEAEEIERWRVAEENQTFFLSDASWAEKKAEFKAVNAEYKRLAKSEADRYREDG